MQVTPTGVKAHESFQLPEHKSEETMSRSGGNSGLEPSQVIEIRSDKPTTFTYSSGTTALDMFYNASLWGFRLITRSNEDNIGQAKKKFDKDRFSTAQILWDVFHNEIDVGCNAGATVNLLMPFFGPGQDYARYLPMGTTVEAFALALENPSLAQNARLIQTYCNFLVTFSDNVEAEILPIMTSKTVSTKGKVLRMLELLSLDVKEDECRSTPLESFFKCFERLSEEEQGEILENVFEDVEGTKLEALKASDSAESVQKILHGYLGEFHDEDVDLARLELMQYHASQNRSDLVRRHYQELTMQTRVELAKHEIEAQERSKKDRRPIPGQDGYTYFNDQPCGSIAQKALEVEIAALNLKAEEYSDTGSDAEKL